MHVDTPRRADTPPRAGRREWIGLAVIALPCMLYSMDLTVLNLAVPTLRAELQPSSAQLLWIIDIYGFMVAGSLITRRTVAIGVWVTSYSVGGAIGPLLGGILLQYFWWGSVFLLGVPVMLLLLGVLTQVDGGSGLAVLITGSVIYSVGISPVVILATDLIVGSAPVERAGAASAVSETSSELGGALGIAILGSIGTAVYRSRMVASMPAGVPPEAAEAARATLGGAIAVAQQLPERVGAALIDPARAAFVQAFQLVAIVCAGAVLVLAVLMLMRMRSAPDQPPTGGVAPG